MPDVPELYPGELECVQRGLSELASGNIVMSTWSFAIETLRRRRPTRALKIRKLRKLSRAFSRGVTAAGTQQASTTTSPTLPDWLVGMTDEFTKGVLAVDRKLQGRVLEAISVLVKQPTSVRGDKVKPLTGDMKHLWRCRIGDYRLVYQPDTKTRAVLLISFTTRDEAYE